MKTFQIYLFAALFIISTHVHSQTYHETLAGIAQDNNLVGMSVLVMCNGNIANTFHYGLSNIDDNIPVSDRTYYRIASISKSITATAMMQLYEAGHFNLQDDINDYLDFDVQNPNFPNDAITFEMLLSHTSTLQDGSGYSNFLSATYNQTPPPHISEVVQPSGDYYTTNMWQNEQPGSYFTYSNINFGLIATLIEQISGERFDLYVRDKLLVPLNIDGSFNVDHITDIENVAVLYRNGIAQADNYQGTHPSPFDSAAYTIGTNGTVFAPQGGLRISVPGLFRFMSMHSNNGTYENTELLSKETIELMHAPVWTYNGSNGFNYYNLFNSWGLGVQITTNTANGDIVIPGTRMIGHPGEAYGLISDMYFEKEKQFGIIFLTNGYYSGGYDFGNTSAFYVPEEETFLAVNEFLFDQCDTLSAIDNNALANAAHKMYFNAANNQIVWKNIDPKGQFRLVSMSGNIVFETYNRKNRLQLPRLNAGVYVVHWHGKKQTRYLKIAL